jgi:hypothetical protein
VSQNCAVRGSLDSSLRLAGRQSGIIQQLLPCLDKPQTIYVPNVTHEMIATLRREHSRLSERIECLARNRDAIADYLDTVLSVKSANNESRARIAPGCPPRRDRRCVTAGETLVRS